MYVPFYVIGNVKAFVQTPVDVIVTDTAALSTVTTLPANNSVFVAVLGLTTPVFAVKLKLGPKSVPNPAFNVNVKVILFYFNLYINF
jgi:hypothetical protein